jgi:hypothetical protein
MCYRRHRMKGRGGRQNFEVPFYKKSERDTDGADRHRRASIIVMDFRRIGFSVLIPAIPIQR